MQDASADDRLTISGNYAASGNSRLAVDVIGMGTGLASDRLVIGGNVTRTTTILANIVNPVIDVDGVLIVDAGGTVGAGAFTLDGPTNLGLINLGLQTRGNDVYLAATPDSAVGDVGILASLASDSWYQSTDAHLACAASRRNALGVERKLVSLCGQVYFGRDRYGDRSRTVSLFGSQTDVGGRLETERRGAQFEVAFQPGRHFNVGFAGGIGKSEADRTEFGTDMDSKDHYVGMFGEYGSAAGFYAGVLANVGFHELDLANERSIDPVRVSAESTGIDGYLGWRSAAFGANLDAPSSTASRPET